MQSIKKCLETNAELFAVVFLFISIILILVSAMIIINKMNYKKQKDNLQKELEYKDAVLQAIFDAIPDFMFCKDLDLNYTRVNKKIEDFFDVCEADVIGKDDAEGLGFLLEGAQQHKKSEKKMLKKGRLTVSKEFVQGADGTEILCETIRIPVIQNNIIVGLIGIARDITDRQAMEKDILEASKAKDEAIKALKIRENMTDTLNKMSAIFLSQDNESFEGKMTAGIKSIIDIIDLDRLSVWRIHKKDNGGMNTSQVYRWDKYEGGTTPPVPELVDVPLIKITKRWKQILSGKEKINGSLKSMKNPPEAFIQFGMVSALLTPLVFNNEYWGFVLFEDSKNERVFDEDEAEVMRSAAYLCANTVMRNEMETKLNEALDESAIASRAKGELLSRMNHEIFTPLNAIISMIGVGAATNDVKKKDYCFERADSASKHLLSLINDMFDMSKIEAGKFELSNDEIDFEKLLMDITNLASIRAEEKHQKFSVNFFDDLPDYIEGDALRFSQIITNLLSNAIKFTPEKGTVTLNVEKTKEQGSDVFLRFEIIDTGIGVSKKQQKEIFTSFNQADTDNAKEFGGVGLGLAISKHIVELMGGKIWIESKLEKGAKFIFTIKVKKLEKEKINQLSLDIKAEDLHILIIDYSIETRKLFARVMEGLDLSYSVAEGGIEALDMIDNAADRPFNMVFINCKISGMDGIKLAKKIKGINSEIKIIMISSITEWNKIKKKASVAGLSHYVFKPLFPAKIIEAINSGFDLDENDSFDEMPETENKPRFNFLGCTLLIVDDMDINREIMNAILEETKVSMYFAKSGEAAVEMFEEHPEKYNLILMDVNMPGMDGYETARIIRGLDIPIAKNIPIIAMTENVFKEDIEKCLAAGMTDYTGKPIDAKSLFEKLNKYLTYPAENIKKKNVYKLDQGIAWDESLMTGNVQVDMQHQKIFKKVSNLVYLCEDGSDINKLSDTLEFLVKYAIQHFTDEEALQIEYGYPEYENHKKEHDDFKITVSDLVQRFKEKGSSAELSHEVNSIIVKWLVSHIQHEDKKISEYIRKVSVE